MKQTAFCVISHEDLSTLQCSVTFLNETICHLCRLLDWKWKILCPRRRHAVFSLRGLAVIGAVFVVALAVILLPWRHLRVALRRSWQRPLKLMTAGFLETTSSRSSVVFPPLNGQKHGEIIIMSPACAWVWYSAENKYEHPPVLMSYEVNLCSTNTFLDLSQTPAASVRKKKVYVP